MMVKFDNRGKVKRRPNLGESQEVLKSERVGDKGSKIRGDLRGPPGVVGQKSPMLFAYWFCKN